MHQLSGEHVNVVLAVEEGKGLDFVKNPMAISACFNGRVLDSDPVTPEDCPAFDTKLVWEIAKKDLRKIRSSNQPLRLECVCFDANNRKERIGFILLSLRSAQIIPLPSNENKTEEVKSKWHRLLGVQSEKRSCHPELYLSLSIRDFLFNHSSEVIDSLMPFITEVTDEEQITSDESVDHIVKAGINVQYLEDGYIRIGSEKNATQAFSLNILTKSASNLDLLLPEILVFRETRDKYYITFKLFGISLKTKPFAREMHETIELNEKIVVRLLSNLATLKEYFENQFVDIGFYCGPEKLGITKIELKKLITDEGDEEFCNVFTCVENYEFSFPSGSREFIAKCDRRPFVNVETSLCKDRERRSDVMKNRKSALPLIDKNIENACGDQEPSYRTDAKDIKLGRLSRVDKKAQSEPIIHNEEKHDNRAKSLDTIVKNIMVSPPNYEKIFQVSEYYDSYCLGVILENIQWKRFLKDTKILFKFMHPKCANYSSSLKELDNTVGDDIPMYLKFRIFYISKDGGVKLLLKAWPPRLALADEKGKLISDEIDIDTRSFYDNTATTISYSCDIRAVRTLEVLGRLKIQVCLEKLDQFIIKENNFDDILMPPVLDEFIILGEITDLQRWKQEEKDKFLEELKKQQAQQRDNNQKKWAAKKDELEKKLSKQIKKCKNLQTEMKKILNHLKTQKALKKMKKSSNTKLISIKYSKCSNKELIDILSKTEEENEKLKELLAEQRQQFEAFQKSALTKEQTGNLLQELRILEEKFTEAQTAKQYFKEQWRKACEEIHELKTEDYRQLQNQIQLDRQELSQLSLDHFVDKFDVDDKLEELYAREGLTTRRSLTEV